MLKYILVPILLIVLSGCGFLENKPREKKDFFNTIAGWDIKHVPIIPPFRASSIGPGTWLITGSKGSIHQGRSEGGDINVLSFGVSKNYVYGKRPNGVWFLFNTNSLLYSEYSTEEELTLTLIKYRLEKNKIDLCDNYFSQLNNGNRCYWYPPKGEEYAKYQEFRPDSCHTINIEGNKQGIEFKLKGKIERVSSKIYYFKIKYADEKNELFYISFDGSSPQLIKNDDIIPAWSITNNTMDITVYTPFDVAQKKGVSEKERLVITKHIEF